MSNMRMPPPEKGDEYMYFTTRNFSKRTLTKVRVYAALKGITVEHAMLLAAQEGIESLMRQEKTTV